MLSVFIRSPPPDCSVDAHARIRPERATCLPSPRPTLITCSSSSRLSMSLSRP
ncbi:hypothetical protein FA13DRAFT_1743946 [Coprinellus micaceus]|uniref:Uncharacterized protein n=1 Tax=Coprinellus micaceus TaxID=71717 RepID=A0A4Y7SED2_COPMI|nr:hypothetical protein FA13DRAFT_1743946 [Coprinellus micaceus]